MACPVGTHSLLLAANSSDACLQSSTAVAVTTIAGASAGGVFLILLLLLLLLVVLIRRRQPRPQPIETRAALNANPIYDWTSARGLKNPVYAESAPNDEFTAVAEYMQITADHQDDGFGTYDLPPNWQDDVGFFL